MGHPAERAHEPAIPAPSQESFAPMVFARPPRSAGVCLLLAVLLAVAAVVVGPSGRARALTDAVGPINVTVSPTEGLADGQAISIHAATTAGTLSEIRAHLCTSAFAAHPNQFSFLFGDEKCTKAAVGTGDFETFQTLGNTTSGDLAFKAGIGSATWVDDFSGGSHTITCDASNPCDLAIQFQSSVSPGLYYFVTPLSYAGEGGTTTTTTTAGGTTTTAGGTTTTTAAGTTTTAAGTTTTTGGTTTTTAGGSTTTTANPSTDGTVTPASAGPGDSIAVASPGWAPNGTVTATLHSDPITLGTATADANGMVTGNYTIPVAAAVGVHQVELVGTSAAGTPRTVDLTLTVTAVSVGTTSTTTTAVAVSGSSTGTGSSSLPFTGAYDANLAAAALAMLGVALFLISFRPRRSARL